MENNSKTYSLVAWTENGRIRLAPELSKEAECSLLDELCALTDDFRVRSDERDRHGRFTMTPKEEIDGRIAISAAYEKLADFYLETEAVNKAWWALTRAAKCCADCSDGLWVHSGSSFHPAVPLVRRFYAVHSRVLQIARRCDRLRELYRGSELEQDYLTFSQDRRLCREEIREADEWRRAMYFGRR